MERAWRRGALLRAAAEATAVGTGVEARGGCGGEDPGIGVEEGEAGLVEGTGEAEEGMEGRRLTGGEGERGPLAGGDRAASREVCCTRDTHLSTSP